MSICQYVSMSICQYVNMSICQYVNMSICQYVNMSICQYGQCFNRSTYQRVNLSTFQYVNVSVFQYVTISYETIPNSLHILVSQYTNIPTFQYSNTSNTTTRKCCQHDCVTSLLGVFPHCPPPKMFASGVQRSPRVFPTRSGWTKWLRLAEDVCFVSVSCGPPAFSSSLHVFSFRGDGFSTFRPRTGRLCSGPALLFVRKSRTLCAKCQVRLVEVEVHTGLWKYEAGFGSVAVLIL